MAAITLPSRWTTQPTVLSRVDSSYPLACGLVLSWEGMGITGTVLRDAWLSNDATSNGSVTPTPYGMGVAFNGSSTRAIRTSIAVSNGFTFITRLKLSNTASVSPYHSIACHHTTNGNPSNWYIYRSSSDNKLHVDVPWVAGDVLVSSSTYSSGEWREVALVRSGSSGSWTYRIYMDGRQDNSATTASNPSGSSHSLALSSIGGDNWANNTHVFARYWNRPLTAAEIFAHYTNPWQMFRPMQRRIYVDLASGTNYTLSATGGSFAVTGTAASLLKGSKVTADSGSFAVTGTAASLLYGRLLSAGSGSFAITGTDVSMYYGKTMTADPGSFTINGTAASLLKGYKVSASAGSFAITGTDATLTYSGQSIWTPRSATSTTWTPRSAQSTTWTAQ